MINKLGGLEILPYMALSYISHFLSTWLYDIRLWSHCGIVKKTKKKTGEGWQKEKVQKDITLNWSICTQSPTRQRLQTHLARARCHSFPERPALLPLQLYVCTVCIESVFFLIDHSRLPLMACDVTNCIHAAVRAELDGSSSNEH